jgi:hypothetical protein
VTIPLVIQAPQEIFDLIHHKEKSLEDIKTYIQIAFTRYKLEAWVDRQNVELTYVIEKLAEKSENNFMYLRYVLHDIERGIYRDLDIENLPCGLESYYEDHWKCMGMTAQPLPHLKITIIYILSEVRQAVSRKLITEFARTPTLPIDELLVQQVLDEWKQFLHEYTVEGCKRYSIYHTSFRDFLHRKDIVQAAGIVIKDIHSMITNDLWQEFFKDG